MDDIESSIDLRCTTTRARSNHDVLDAVDSNDASYRIYTADTAAIAGSSCGASPASLSVRSASATKYTHTNVWSALRLLYIRGYECGCPREREREREREIIISYEQVLDEVQLPTKIVLALAVVRHCQHPHKATLMKDQDTVLNLDAGKVLVESLDRNE